MRRISSTLALASFAVSLLLLSLIWAYLIRARYYPSSDEIALLTASARAFHPNPLSWVNSGFQDYFLAYRSAPRTTDFLRPVVNATYFLNSLLFNERWSFYLLSTYLIQAGLVSATVHFASYRLKLSSQASLLGGLIVLISPAFGMLEMTYPSFAFDLLSGLLVLLGLANFLSQRYVASWVLITLAVFTKESALFAPVIVSLAWLLWLPNVSRARRAFNSALWLLPVVGWLLLRHRAFNNAGNVYVLSGMGLSTLVKNFVHGILAWPFGTRIAGQGHVVQIIFFALNAGFWLSLLLLARRNKIIVKNTIRGDKHNAEELLLLFAFACGSLLMPIAFSLPLRFGGIFFPLATLLLLKTAASDNLPKRKWAQAALCVLAVDGIYQKVIQPPSLTSLQEVWRLSRSEMDAIGQTKSPTLLLFDASAGFASPDRVATFAHYPGRIVRLINIDDITPANCTGQPIMTVTHVPEEITVTSHLATQCASYRFDSLPLETSPIEHRKRLEDGSLTMTYRLPGTILEGGTPKISGTLSIAINAKNLGNTTLLAPDLQRGTYRVAAQ